MMETGRTIGRAAGAHGRVTWLLLSCLCWSLGSAGARAEGSKRRETSPVPKALEEWAAWVDARAEPPCPSDGAELCTFHTALGLAVDAHGGSFNERVALVRDGRVILPGGRPHWPDAVKVDGHELPVVASEGRPSVWLEAGAHTLTGRFSWDTLPDTLPVPRDVGLLSVSVDGRRVDAPRRDDSGVVWLAERDAVTDTRDTLRVTVHRRIRDGVPLRVTSRFTLEVSGKARDVQLPAALVLGSHAVALDASLPSELDKAGNLRVHVEPGEHRVEVEALVPDAAPKLVSGPAAEPWPAQEIWVFAADERLRHVELEGVSPLDPARTELAPDFREPTLQTYAVKRGEPVLVTTKRRGESEPAPNKLSLTRTLWLDLDGRGYTAQDELSGSVAREFRLSLAEGELGRASVDGSDQMITLYGGKPGVELRSARPAVRADVRFPEARAELPAVAYAEDVAQLSTGLNLPPGYRLIYAEGPDTVLGAWANGWNLFDFFFVLLVSIGTGKLVSPLGGVLALITLVLTHDVSDAPAFGWVILLAVRALVAFTRGTRGESWLTRLWLLCLLAMAVALVPLAVLQLREALHPQLASQASGEANTSAWLARESGLEGGMRHQDEEGAMPAAAPVPMSAIVQGGAEGGNAEDVLAISADAAERASVAALSASGGAAGNALGYDRAGALARKRKYEPEPLPVVQTGPGLPRWSFHHYELQYTGPVQHDERISLLIAPPWLSRLWSVLAALLPLALLGVLGRPGSPRGKSPGSVAAAALALCVLTLGTGPARAEATPSPELLNELQQRRAVERACHGEALSVQALSLRIDGPTLTVSADVHAGCDAVYRAPGPLAQWTPQGLTIDGKDALAASRHDDGFLRVRVAPGIHRVELRGPVPRTPAFSLSVGSAPHRASVSAPGYVVEGVKDGGQVDESLSFRREVKRVEEADDKPESAGLTQWVEVTRTLRLGVRLSVVTRVRRLSSAGEDALVRVPLLPGENVSKEGLTSDENGVLVALRRGEIETSYASTLADTAEIKLKAAVPREAPGGGLLDAISERWEIVPTPLYHPTFSGIAPVASLDGDAYAPSFAPYPSEELTIALTRLAPAKGSDVTIDAVHARYTPGTRLETLTLRLDVRTSNGSTETLTFPADVSLRSFDVNGQARPERLKGGKLVVRLAPGQQSLRLEVTRPLAIGARYVPTPVQLGRPVSNVTTEVAVPDGRWLLWSEGPSFGPAILFWGYVLAVLVFGVGLSRLPYAPLGALGFVLLGLGLTQLDAAGAVFVVAWLFALSARAQRAPSTPLAYNTAQVGLIMLTLIALSCLVVAVQRGLLLPPDMQVTGNGSGGSLLRYYVDQCDGALPHVAVLSVSMWVFRGLMLLWALWLSFNLIGWLKRGAEAFRTGGMFRSLARRAEAPSSPPLAQRAPTSPTGTAPGIPPPPPSPERPSEPR